MAKHKKQKQLSNKKKKNQQKKADAAPPKIPTVEELIEAGDAASASNESDKALAFYASADDVIGEKKSPATTEQHVYVLEKLGEARASTGDVETALQDFQRAVALMMAAPEEQNPRFLETLAGLHLYVGQVSAEKEALEALKKGLQCLEASVQIRQQICANTPATVSEDDEMMDTAADNSDHPSVALNEARQKLASARVTVAELYLTDLCFEENAESECEAYVTKALEITDVDGEPMVDALQTAASLRLSQQRQKEARTLVLKAYKKMQTGCEALAKLVGLGETNSKEEAVELLEVDAANNLPTLEFRSQTAKLLMECGAGEEAETEEVKQCHQAAIQVLGSLMAENDEIPEVWYLMGCAFQAAKNNDNAKYYWNKALEMLTNIQKQMEDATDAMEVDDDDNEELDMQLQNVACQMEEIKSRLEDIEES